VSWTRSVAGPAIVALLAALLVVTATGVAAAADGAHRRAMPGQASFEGRQIDLTRGWGDAQACVVWTRDGDTECFRTDAAADAAVDRRARIQRLATAVRSGGPTVDLAPRVQVATSCADWLHLYEHVGFGGRSLRFRDRGFTQDLASWGFAGQTSSFRVGGCPATFRDAGWAEYPGASGADASAWSMASGWNDRVRYLRID
jgi:hypothetical protein